MCVVVVVLVSVFIWGAEREEYVEEEVELRNLLLVICVTFFHVTLVTSLLVNQNNGTQYQDLSTDS